MNAFTKESRLPFRSNLMEQISGEPLRAAVSKTLALPRAVVVGVV